MIRKYRLDHVGNKEQITHSVPFDFCTLLGILGQNESRKELISHYEGMDYYHPVDESKNFIKLFS